MGDHYRYDGTDAGLLTLLAHCLEHRIEPETIGIEPSRQQGLFDTDITIATDEDCATAFWRELCRRLPAIGFSHLRTVLLASLPGREVLIYRYCRLAWQEGGDAVSRLSHRDVAPIWKLSQQVGREAHRYLGFVRFQEVTGGFYYSAIAPDHRILPLIAAHFAARFRDQHWVIHDQRHCEGVIYDQERCKWLLVAMEAHAAPEFTPTEERLQSLWREYFATLTIAARENRRLQRSKVPLKVRPWLTEFNSAISTSER